MPKDGSGSARRAREEQSRRQAVKQVMCSLNATEAPSYGNSLAPRASVLWLMRSIEQARLPLQCGTAAISRHHVRVGRLTVSR
jgi:hypothetical protein